MSTAPELWLGGPIAGIDPLLMPIAHALLQAREDLDRVAPQLKRVDLWKRTGGAASIGFHLRHAGGALDRLFAYARGETLSDAHRAVLARERLERDDSVDAQALVAGTQAAIDRALDQLRRTPASSLLEARAVGRAALPSNVLGLLFHAGEHTTRHMGQLVTTMKIAGSV